MSHFLRPKAPTPVHVVDLSSADAIPVPESETPEQVRARLRDEDLRAVRVFAVVLGLLFSVGLSASWLLLHLAERRTP